MHIKSTMSYNFTPGRGTIIKQNLSVGEDVGKQKGTQNDAAALENSLSAPVYFAGTGTCNCPARFPVHNKDGGLPNLLATPSSPSPGGMTSLHS